LLDYCSPEKIYIGARFNSTLNKWFWSDGSEANFPPEGLSDCRQKALLRTATSWSILNDECNGVMAYYACQVKRMYRNAFPE